MGHAYDVLWGGRRLGAIALLSVLVLSEPTVRAQSSALAAPQASSPVSYLKASNPGEDDHLGADGATMGVTLALSADGNTLAVSAPHEDSGAQGINGDQSDDSMPDAGAVYVFARRGNVWFQQAYIKASNTGAWDQFGFAVALSGDGDTLAVGANLEDSAARGIDAEGTDDSAENSGAVYVFVRKGDTWTQQAYIKASNVDAEDQFGYSLALDQHGTTLAVGADGEASGATGVDADQADNTAELTGAVYVFTRRGGTWSQQSYIKAANAEQGDLFGFCVALASDGNRLAICGYDEDGGSKGIGGDASDNSANGSGAAYVFGRRGDAWVQETYIKASNTRKGDAFGSAIALSGDGKTLAVCAVDEDGLSAGIDGDQGGEQLQEHSTGAVFVFGESGGRWAQQAYVKSTPIQPNDQFGLRLALSEDGDLLATGAPLQPGGGRGFDPDPADFSAPESGAVYLFARTQGRWAQRAYIKAPNAEAYDEFGGALGLSGDGRTLAVAARGEDGAATGFNGDESNNAMRDSGAVYVYQSP
jgi:FG-GAP repeat